MAVTPNRGGGKYTTNTLRNRIGSIFSKGVAKGKGGGKSATIRASGSRGGGGSNASPV